MPMASSRTLRSITARAWLPRSHCRCRWAAGSVHFEVTMSQQKLKDALANGLEKTFKLKSSISTSGCSMSCLWTEVPLVALVALVV